MSTPIIADPLPFRVEPSGAVRVGKSRVSLESVIVCHRRGDSPATIQDNFPTLELADIYGVISFYLKHTAEVDQYLAEQRAEAEEIRQQLIAEGRSPANPAELLATLKSRWEAGQSSRP